MASETELEAHIAGLPHADVLGGFALARYTPELHNEMVAALRAAGVTGDLDEEVAKFANQPANEARFVIKRAMAFRDFERELAACWEAQKSLVRDVENRETARAMAKLGLSNWIDAWLNDPFAEQLLFDRDDGSVVVCDNTNNIKPGELRADVTVRIYGMMLQRSLT